MSFVDECRREWKRLGVPDPVANEMAAELTADLAEAEAEGASPEEVLGYDVFDARGFAAQWAEERGLIGHAPAPPRRWLSLALVAALAISLAVTAAGVALLADRGHFASARIAVGQSFPARRFRFIPAPNGPLSPRPPQVVIPPSARRVLQVAALPNPPATAGVVFLVVGIGGIAATVAAWLVLDRRRRVIL